MIKSQENKFTMAKAVSSYLGENEHVTSGIPELIQHLNSLNIKFSEIEAKDTEHKTFRKGKLNVKYYEKSEAIKKAMGVSGAVNAYAVKNGLIELETNSKITKSSLESMRDAELVGRLRFILELASENLQYLEPYGITQAKFEAYSRIIDKYEFSVGQSESSKAVQKGAKKTLRQLFDELDKLLFSIDRLANGLLESNPEFVRNYRLTRKIYNPGTRHRQQENTAGNSMSSAGSIKEKEPEKNPGTS